MPVEAGSGSGSANDATIIVEKNVYTFDDNEADEAEQELAVEAEPKENN